MRDFLAATRDRVIVFDGGMGATLEQFDLDLERDYPDLWVFESLDDARGTPVALCVGRMDPASLAQGRVFSVTAGGDAGEGQGRRRTLASHHGWTLAVTEGGPQSMDRAHGVIGRCG